MAPPRAREKTPTNRPCVVFFNFSYLPVHWDARYRPKKRLPRLTNQTKKAWRDFMQAYPRFRKDFRGVSREMFPFLEDHFKIRIEAYQKTRDREDPKLCEYRDGDLCQHFPIRPTVCVLLT